MGHYETPAEFVVGLGTYDSGPGALLAGPIVAAGIAGLVWSRVSSRAGRTRLVLLATLAAAAAVAVGVTILV